MSAPPNRRLHEDGGSGSGNNSHPPISKYPLDDQEVYAGVGGKVASTTRLEYHTPYDVGQEGRMPKMASRNESRETDRRSPLLPNMLFRVSTPSDVHSDHVGSGTRMDFRDSKESTKETKVDNRDLKPESRELHQMSKSDKYDSRADDSKDPKHERDTYSELKANEKLDKDGYIGSSVQLDWTFLKEQLRVKQYPDVPGGDGYIGSSVQLDWTVLKEQLRVKQYPDVPGGDGYIGSSGQLNWKDLKEQLRVKQYPDVPGGNAETWHTSRTVLHGPADATKEGLYVDDRNIVEAREAVGENRVDMKGEEKFKEKDKKRKEVKHWDWGEKDKERSDRRNNLQLANSTSENREIIREERESERWGNGKKELIKEKEKPIEKENDHIKRELWIGMDKETLHNEKELIDFPGKCNEHEFSTSDPKKKDHDTWKNVDREARDRKKERDTDIELERADKRIKYHDKESDEGGMNLECSTEQEREAFNSGQQRKRMLRPRSSPQIGNHDQHYRSCANDNEGSLGKGDMSCVVYKIGECMQDLLKLWKEYYSSQTEKSCGGTQNGPTLEIRIPAEHVTATNRQVRGGQLWGTDIYTVDSDLVAVLMHTGYCRPTASPPPSSTQELKATIKVLPSQDCYISTLRNNVRSRAWGAAIGCSYRVEQCSIVKKGGGIIDLEPCLTHSSTMEPTLAPVAVERTMTTRAAASNALRQQRFVREVTIQFNLCMEPWLKYSISVVADKGLKKFLFTSARLKKGEVLYVETHSCRYELCFNGEKVVKLATTPHTHGAETGRVQAYNSHLANGEKSAADCESTLVDIFRWSHCKRPLPQKTMQSIGIPLPHEHIEVLEENLEWDDISWSPTGAWIAGKGYPLARAHFLSPN